MKIRYALAAAGIVTALAQAPAFAQADNTNSRWSPSVFDTWMTRDYSSYTADRNAREAYRAQEQRRQDAIERHERLSRAPYDPYYVAPAEQYDDFAPNPTRVEPSNSSTNPTGNEPAGENSGGK